MLQIITMNDTNNANQTPVDSYYDEADLNLDDEELNLDFLDE